MENIKEYNHELVEEFIFQLRKAENTKKSYQRDLSLFSVYLATNDIKIDSLTYDTVQMFINGLETGRVKGLQGKKLGSSTINRIFAAICAFAKYSGQSEAVYDIDINRPTDINSVAPKSLPFNSLDKIRLSIANNRKASSQRDVAILDTLINTGIRVSELVNLKLSDITFDTDKDTKERTYYYHIRTSKGKVSRNIPVKEKFHKYTQRYINSRNDDCEYLFVSQRQSKLTTRSIQLLLKKYDVTPHQLRHTFCSGLNETGSSISDIANLAGHTNIETTRRYTRQTLAQQADAIEKALSR
ncbi:tyrosine-type recombinase/integrase [Alkalihalobacillus sp. NPDC078783]|uniref:tyrosine-type recombinase/integrase n=1 Tax=Streptomyces albidoflavus TaxID=1886 RepID=UPI00340CEBF5